MYKMKDMLDSTEISNKAYNEAFNSEEGIRIWKAEYNRLISSLDYRTGVISDSYVNYSATWKRREYAINCASKKISEVFDERYKEAEEKLNNSIIED